MVDPRIYRTLMVLVLAALIVFAFSFEDQPGAATTTLAPAALSAAAIQTVMTNLEAAYPDRTPGSEGDGGLAEHVGGQLHADGFSLSTASFEAQTSVGARTLQTVTATRTGQASGTIVVLADRDLPGIAGLSGTAAMLQIAGVLSGASMNHTLMLVSTSGSIGAAGATEVAQSLAGQSIDAVIVLGDLAGAHITEPIVVPWSGGVQIAPLLLRNTLAAEVRSLAGVAAGGAGFGAQIAHLGFPLTTTDQGPFGSLGIPAVLLSTSGNRQPSTTEPISDATAGELAQAALQTLDALDAGPTVPAPSAYLTIASQVVPAWAVSLLVLAFILPVLVTTIDALARARRRGHSIRRWMLWILSSVLPFLAAFAVVLVVRLSGWLPVTPPAPVGAGGVPLATHGIIALAIIALVIVASFLWLRPLCIRRAAALAPGTAQARPGEGAAVALALVMCAAALLTWIVNPFAAVLIVPALHAWLWLGEARVRGRRALQVVLVALGVVPPALVVFYYAHSLGLSLVEIPWNGLLALVSGWFGPLPVILWSVLLGCSASALVIVVRSQPEGRSEEPAVKTRGPITYAGPGSLGGPGSALRR